MPCARRIVVRILSVTPFRIDHHHLPHRLPDEIALSVRARHGRLRNGGFHEVGIAHGPLQRLDPAHRTARDGDEPLDLQALGQHPVLGVHHVADVEAREFHVESRAGRRGRRIRIRRGDAERVGLDDEVALRIESLAASDPVRLAVAIALEAVQRQDRVAPFLVERAERDVGHAQIADHFSALELEIAELARLDRARFDLRDRR